MHLAGFEPQEGDQINQHNGKTKSSVGDAASKSAGRALERKPQGMKTPGSFNLAQLGMHEYTVPLDEDDYQRKHSEILDRISGVLASSADYEQLLPKTFALKPAYPNPFNPTVVIPFNVPKQSAVKIAVYNVLGQEVEVLVDGQIKAGFHKIIWNSDKSAISNVASGMYFVKMEAKGFVKSQKIVLMK